MRLPQGISTKKYDINVAISFSCMEIYLYVVCGHMYTVISLILMNEWTFF